MYKIAPFPSLIRLLQPLEISPDRLSCHWPRGKQTYTEKNQIVDSWRNRLSTGQILQMVGNNVIIPFHTILRIKSAFINKNRFSLNLAYNPKLNSNLIHEAFDIHLFGDKTKQEWIGDFAYDIYP
jgi:hypothetical protein